MSVKKHLLVEYLNNLNGIVNQPLQVTQRIKYTSFDVSANYLLFGATSGGIYVFHRQPCKFLKLLPNKEGAISMLSISSDERTIAACTPKGTILVFQNCIMENYAKPKIFTELEGSIVTAIRWHRSFLYCGDNSGKISVINIKNSLATAIFQSSFYNMVTLESSIVQIDTLGKFILISTKTRSILVDTEVGQFAQVGKKLRDGNFGACFHDPNKKEEEKPTQTRDRKFLNLGLDELYEEDPVDPEARIYCARPGCRLWEANFDPAVICTHQFKNSLLQFPSRIISLDEEQDHRLNLLETSESDYVSPDNLSFEKVFSVDNKFIFTFNNEGFYVLDVSHVSVLFWCNKFKNIRDVKLFKNYVYVWHGSGNFNAVCIYELENLILDTLFKKQYYVCSELCLYYLPDVLNLIEKSERIRLVIFLKNKLLEKNNSDLVESLKPLLNRIEEINVLNTPEIPNLKKGIHVVENNHSISKANSLNFNDSDSQELPESIKALIDIGSVVGEKITEGTQNVIEKIQILHETVVNLTSDDGTEANRINGNVDVLEDDSNNRYCCKSHENSNNVNNINENKEDEVIKDNEEENPFLDKNYTINTLYKYYQICNGNSIYMPKLNDFFGATDLKEVFNIFNDFKDFVNNRNPNENIDTSAWCTKQYYLYLSTIDFEALISNFEIDSSNFSCLLESYRSLDVSEAMCQCSYPLPQAKLTVPQFYKIGYVLLKRCWESKQFYEEFLHRHPYFWKYFLCSLNKEEEFNEVILPLIVQYNDLQLFSYFSPKITHGLWEKILRLFIKLKKGLCLNCDKTFEVADGSLLRWTDFGNTLVASIGGPATIKLLMRYSKFIPSNELGMEFYQTCIFSQTFNNCNEKVNQKSVQFVQNASSNQNTFNKWNEILSKYLEEPKVKLEVSCDNVTTQCSNCDLPLTSAVLDECSRVNCGHYYHKFCIKDILKNTCKICDIYVIYPSKF